MRELITLDPGLDDTGVVFWELPDGPVSSMPQMLAALKSVQRWKTKTADPLPERLASLAARAQASGSRRVFIERSTFAGVYQARQVTERAGSTKNAASLNLMHAAIGALVGGFSLGGAKVTFLPPSQIKKEVRQARLSEMLTRLQAHLVLPEKERKLLTNSDVLDAIYLGIYHAIPSL